MIDLILCFAALTLSATGNDGPTVSNSETRLVAIHSRGTAIGVRLEAGQRTLAELHFGPNGLWSATRSEGKRIGETGVLRFSGFDTGGTGATPRLGSDSFVELSLKGDEPSPKVRFLIDVRAFDEAAWQAALPPAAPFYFLSCTVPDALMFYRGGGLIPTPTFNPYPLSRQGVMSGTWSRQWSFAATMEAFAVPALGLWNPGAGVFVGYDFGEARHTDRSCKYLGSAYCAGEGRHAKDMFCLVYPHAKHWVDLRHPLEPVRLESHFELVYSTELGADRDPNELVLKRFVREHLDLLRPAPAMNDLSWIRDPGRIRLPHVVRRSTGSGLTHRSGPHYLEGAFCELDALMLGCTYPGDGVRAIYQAKNRRAIDRLHEDLELLKQHAVWKTIEGDRCCTWVHPLEGKFKDRWGGEECAGYRHKCTWQIGTAMAVVYANERDESLLPFIDGVYNWTKHALYTRNGVCDIPWAMFCHIGLAAGENFMLTYRQAFCNDPVRKRNLAEALRLATMVAYKSMWFYLADPDETDGMDPLFLGQAVVDRRWIGRVTWNECGWPPRTAIPLYCETGDPFLRYFVRGVAANFFVGYREDGGIAENVNISGETEPKGRRTAGTSGISNAAQLRRWAEPAGASRIRICIGEKAAIAFCKKTTDYDIADYAYKPELNCRFRLVARPGTPNEPLDVTITAPFRDLRTRAIRINGEPVPPHRVELNDFTDGEDAYVREVRPGEVIEIGDATGATPAPSDPMPYRSRADAAPRQLGGFRTIDLSGVVDERLEMRFGEEGSWYGWLYGLKWRSRVPYYFLDPGLTKGRACVRGRTGESPRVSLDPADCVFAVFAVHGEELTPPTSVGRVRLTGVTGKETLVDVTSYRWLDVNCSLPIRTFNTYTAMLSLPGGELVRALEVLEGRLFAATTLSRDSDLARELRREFDSVARQALAEGQKGRYVSAHAVCEDRLPWADAASSRRLVLDVTAEQEVSHPVLRVLLDLGLLARQVGAEPMAGPVTVRAIDQTNGAGRSVAAQFDHFDNGRGTLVIVPSDALKEGSPHRYAVYFGGPPSAEPAAPRVQSGASAATFDSGSNGVRCVFDLSGGAAGPRLMDVRFDANGDGKFDEPNVLGPTGFSGGYGCLTAVCDPYFWFNFGHWQTEPARARVVHAGPASATIAVENLHLFGCGGPLDLTLGGRWEGKQFTIGKKGAARWFFRVYAGRPYLDQWVEWQMKDGDTCWTRPLQVRYGLANYDPSIIRVGGQPGQAAETKDFCVLPAQEGPPRLVPTAARTRDGHVVEVQLDKSQRPGQYASSFWRMGPSALGVDELRRSLAPVAVQVYALERREGERIVRRTPEPMRGSVVASVDGPLVEPGPEPALSGTLNWDTSFEKTKQYWGISRDAAWSRKAARTGNLGALLEVSKEMGKELALVQTGYRANREMALDPNTRYKLTFWARCLSEKGLLHTNLYRGRGHDFEQIRTELPGDGKWHRYTVRLRTGQYPPPGKGVFAPPSRIFPALRLWCLGMDQVVHVDDVCLCRDTETP